jgi:hypothetical protein
VKKPERRQYLKNAYRVLLTRARQGMVIFVPPGAKQDPTRNPKLYEAVSQYLIDPGANTSPGSFCICRQYSKRLRSRFWVLFLNTYAATGVAGRAP